MDPIRQEDWENMPRANRLAAIEGLGPVEAAGMFAGMRPLANIGPRLSREEWRLLGRSGRQELLPKLEPWEAAIVSGWSAMDKRVNKPLWREVVLLVFLAYPVFCGIWAALAGIREYQAGLGANWPVWRALTSEVPGMVMPSLRIKTAVKAYLAQSYPGASLPEEGAEWEIKRGNAAGEWRVSVNLDLATSDGASRRVPTQFEVRETRDACIVSLGNVLE
jgi:hypothetical protein